MKPALAIATAAAALAALLIVFYPMSAPAGPLVRVLIPCIDATGMLFWVRVECPEGSAPAAESLPNACDEGWCVSCPPDGCPPLESTVMCCCGSGPGGCFEIIATTLECGTDPSCDVLYCDYGYCDADGEAHCIIE